MTGHNDPLVLRRKPKNQPLKTVLMPLTKSRIPATEPKDLPALSLPIARQVAKIGERPILVRAMASVAATAFGLIINATNPKSVIVKPSMTIRHEPMRSIKKAAPNRLPTAIIQVILLSTAAIAGVCAYATCKYAGVHVRMLELIPEVNIITRITGANIFTNTRVLSLFSLLPSLRNVEVPPTILYCFGIPGKEIIAPTVKHIVKIKQGRGSL